MLQTGRFAEGLPALTSQAPSTAPRGSRLRLVQRDGELDDHRKEQPYRGAGEVQQAQSVGDLSKRRQKGPTVPKNERVKMERS